MNRPGSDEWGAHDHLHERHASRWLRWIEEATDENPNVRVREVKPRHRRREWRTVLRFRLGSGLGVKFTVPGVGVYAFREMDRELEDWKNLVLARRSR